MNIFKNKPNNPLQQKWKLVKKKIKKMLSNIKINVTLLQNSMRVEKGYFSFGFHSAKVRFLQLAFLFLVISSSICVIFTFCFIWGPVVLSLNWSALTPSHDSCFRRGHRNYLPGVSWQNSTHLTAPCSCRWGLDLTSGLPGGWTWRFGAGGSFLGTADVILHPI